MMSSKTMRKFLRTGLIGLFMSLAACSVTEWAKPGVSKDQAAFDRQECRSLARAETERALRRQPLPQPSSGQLIGSEYDTAMARYDASRQSDTFFRSCMENKGYHRTSKPMF